MASQGWIERWLCACAGRDAVFRAGGLIRHDRQRVAGETTVNPCGLNYSRVQSEGCPILQRGNRHRAPRAVG